MEDFSRILHFNASISPAAVQVTSFVPPPEVHSEQTESETGPELNLESETRIKEDSNNNIIEIALTNWKVSVGAVFLSGVEKLATVSRLTESGPYASGGQRGRLDPQAQDFSHSSVFFATCLGF